MSFLRSTARRPLRALVAGTVGLAVVLTPLALTTSGAAAAPDPKHRVSAAPQVFYPLVGSAGVTDRRSYTAKSGQTRISAPCGKTVRASTPGTARVIERTVRGATRYVVRVHTGSGTLWTGASYLSRVSVSNGQIIAAGQRLGRLGAVPGERGCALRFKVSTGKATTNATTWLARHVGRAQPLATLYGNAGFTVASFNILGASHTDNNARRGYAGYQSRLERSFRLLDKRGVDVVGLQEYQTKQHDYAVRKGYFKSAWDSYYWTGKRGKRDTDNAILWRRDKFEKVEAHTFDIPYHRGVPRAKPAVLLREKATGRTAWFLNVHNPATGKRIGNNARYRAEAVAIERQKVVELRASGRPVFLIGDMNENESSFCALTAGKLMISPNSLPSASCAMPRKFHSIDWIFGAGQVRFTSFAKDMYPWDAKITDHPIILSRAHLQG